MTDELEKLFQDLRARALSEIVPPGAPQARVTVRRRRSAAVFAGTGVAVAAVLIGAGIGLHPNAGGDYAAGPAGPEPSSADPSGYSPPLIPEPSGPAYDHARAAGDLLADRARTPTSIDATSGVVTSDYESYENDMPADRYAFRFFCVGAGKVQVVVKQGDSGNTVLGHGTAICAAHDPAPLRLTIDQPAYGYLRIFASGDARSNETAGFAFEFLSTTGKTGFGPSGPPYSFTPSAGTLSVETAPS